MGIKGTFTHKISEKFYIVHSQHDIKKALNEYDSELVNACKQQYQQYLELIVKNHQELLPPDISLESIKNAYSKSYFDWDNFDEWSNYETWLLDNVFQDERDYQIQH